MFGVGDFYERYVTFALTNGMSRLLNEQEHLKHIGRTDGSVVLENSFIAEIVKTYG